MRERGIAYEVLATAAVAPAQMFGVALAVTAVLIEFVLLTLLLLATVAVPASIIVGLLFTALAQ